MNAIDKLTMLHMAVRNMDEVKQFYTEKLGFKVTNDFSYNEAQAKQVGLPAGSRWISLELPGGGESINLTNVFENMNPGSMKLYLSTIDIEHAYKELTARGVVPTADITHAGWGTHFSFSDPDGNQWLVVESKN
jgi:uncharacterized glyoxalase superfamily protein PhnB